MGQKYAKDDRLIFHKKLLKPINVDKWKCLSHFKIKGFRCWKSPLLEICEAKDGAAETFTIELMLEGKRRKVIVPSHLFLLTDFNVIVSKIKKLMSNFVNFDSHCKFDCLNENVFHFSVSSPNIDFQFGKSLCVFFGFRENRVYDMNSAEKLFFPRKSFRDLTCDHVGVSVNFGHNDMITRHEIIGILSCHTTPIMAHFDFDVIDRPMFMNLKFESIYEMEVQFVNLSNGQVLNNISNSNEQELFVTMAFSEI